MIIIIMIIIIIIINTNYHHDQVDEDNLSPVADSPIAVCPRVTPLDQLGGGGGGGGAEDADSCCSSLTEDTASVTGTVVELGSTEAGAENSVMEQLQSLDLGIKSFSLPSIQVDNSGCILEYQ